MINLELTQEEYKDLLELVDNYHDMCKIRSIVSAEDSPDYKRWSTGCTKAEKLKDILQNQPGQDEEG